MPDARFEGSVGHFRFSRGDHVVEIAAGRPAGEALALAVGLGVGVFVVILAEKVLVVCREDSAPAQPARGGQKVQADNEDRTARAQRRLAEGH